MSDTIIEDTFQQVIDQFFQEALEIRQKETVVCHDRGPVQTKDIDVLQYSVQKGLSSSQLVNDTRWTSSVVVKEEGYPYRAYTQATSFRRDVDTSEVLSLLASYCSQAHEKFELDKHQIRSELIIHMGPTSCKGSAYFRLRFLY